MIPAARLRELAATGYTDREIGDALGVSRRTARRWRQALAIEPGVVQVPPVVEVRHGTPTGYRQGCREDCCRVPANARREAHRVARQRETARVATHAYGAWTAFDDAVVRERGPVDAAFLLGRTYAGVIARRAHLRRRDTRRSQDAPKAV